MPELGSSPNGNGNGLQAQSYMDAKTQRTERIDDQTTRPTVMLVLKVLSGPIKGHSVGGDGCAIYQASAPWGHQLIVQTLI